MRFYITKWPLEYGIIVCEGKVTAKQAKIDKELWEHTQYRHTFSSDEFTTALGAAKKEVEGKLLDDIRFHEFRIQRLKNTLANVRALTEDAAVWTNTRGEDPDED